MHGPCWSICNFIIKQFKFSEQKQTFDLKKNSFLNQTRILNHSVSIIGNVNWKLYNESLENLICCWFDTK